MATPLLCLALQISSAVSVERPELHLRCEDCSGCILSAVLHISTRIPAFSARTKSGRWYVHFNLLLITTDLAIHQSVAIGNL